MTLEKRCTAHRQYGREDVSELPAEVVLLCDEAGHFFLVQRYKEIGLSGIISGDLVISQAVFGDTGCSKDRLVVNAWEILGELSNILLKLFVIEMC